MAALKSIIASALRAEDPQTFGEYAEAALRLGGPAAVDDILKGPKP